MQPVSRTIVINQGKILLLKNKYSDGIFYGFPGGWQEIGETEEECAIRETKEETNLDVKLKRKLYIHEFQNNSKHLHTTYFLAEPISNPHNLTIHNDPDTQDKKPQEVLWIDIDKLKTLPMRPNEFIDILLTDYQSDFPSSRIIPKTRV